MRKVIQSILPYRVGLEKYNVRLDNNECPLNLFKEVDLKEIQTELEMNRYPSQSTENLTKAYAEYIGIPKQNILAANGSDEWITLISQFALDPNDFVLVVDPDFSMYEKNAAVMGATTIKIPLNDDFSLPVERILNVIEERKPALFFLSNPCNPSGQLYTLNDIEQIANAMNNINSLFVLDEAYMEFGQQSFKDQLLSYSNVIILRTASKALGMAGLRLGFLLANELLISDIERIKPPYNVNAISAVIGTYLLQQPDLLVTTLAYQMKRKEELAVILKDFTAANQGTILYPSETNFFLLELNDAPKLTEFLKERNIKIRFFGSGRLAKAIRISIGTEEEQSILRDALTEWSEQNAFSS